MAFISVIVPVYNVEPYIHRCVDSILAQTFTDFELILVDDGSPDNCPVICDEYALADNRIHVIHQNNGGLSAARNAGIDWIFANSDSAWVSFVDSDDWVHPCFLEFLFRAVRETGQRVSACVYKSVSQYTPSEKETFSCEVMAWDTFYMRDWGNGVIACNKLYSKELFHGYRFPVGRLHEDEFLTYKLLYQAGKVATVDSVLYYYYQNESSIVKSEFTLARIDGIVGLSEQVRFAKEKGYDELYKSKVRDLAIRIIHYGNTCNESTKLNETEKRQTLRYLRAEMRKLLLHDKKSLPKQERQWAYDFAYPISSRMYWLGVEAMNKMKKHS